MKDAYYPQPSGSQGRARCSSKLEKRFADNNSLYTEYKQWSDWYTTSLLASIRTGEVLTEEQNLHRWFVLYMVVLNAAAKRYKHFPPFQRWAHIDARAYQCSQALYTGYECNIERMIDLFYNIRDNCRTAKVAKKYTSDPPIKILSLKPILDEDGNYVWLPEHQAVKSIIAGYITSFSRHDNAIQMRWKGVSIPQVSRGHRRSKGVKQGAFNLYTRNPIVDSRDYKVHWLLKQHDYNVINALVAWTEKQDLYPSYTKVINMYVKLLRVWATHTCTQEISLGYDDWLLEEATEEKYKTFTNFTSELSGLISNLERGSKKEYE